MGEVIELKRGYDLPAPQRKPGEVPVVSSSGVTGTHDTAKVPAPGVVTGRYGTIGEVFFVQEDFWPLNTALYVRDFRSNDPRFIKYLLQTLTYSKFSDKGAVPGVNRNHLHQAKVVLPPLPEQLRISEVLGALDDKIELNRRMNRTLEEIAQTLFRAWFVDFEGETDLVDSELGLIPRSWIWGRVSDLAKLNPESWTRNESPGTIHYIELSGVSEGEISKITETDFAGAPSRARRRLRDGDTIIGTVRPANRSFTLIQEPVDNLTGSTGFAVLRPKEREHRYFIYLSLTQTSFIDYLASVAHGSAYPAVKSDVIHQAPIRIPPKTLARQFHESVDPLFRRRMINIRQSHILADLRDTLLPKLISGEIRVPEAAEQVEDATGESP